MPRLPAAKKVRQENMLNIRVPNSTDRASRSYVAAEETLPKPSDSTPPDLQNDDDAIFEKTLTSEKKRHMDSLNKLNVKDRELKIEKKKNMLTKMKDMRDAKKDKALNIESSDSEKSDHLFDSDDDVMKVVIGSDEEIQNFSDSQLTHLISIDIPPIIPPSTPTSSRPLKSPQLLSSSQKFQRVKSIRASLEATVGPEFHLVHESKIIKQLSVYEAARFKVLSKLTDAQYDKLDRGRYPCLSNVKTYLKELLEKLHDQRKDGLANFILNDINSMDEFPFEDARINFGIDGGSDCIKVVISYADRKNPQSSKKLRVYKAFYGSEKRDTLLPFADEINAAAEFLQHAPIETKHGLIKFICYFIADCKCGDLLIGIQGGSAIRPCLYCIIPSIEWIKLQIIPDSALRKIEDVQKSGCIIEKAEEESNLSVVKLRALKQQHNSVSAPPLLTAIPISRFVPDAVHINMCAVNSIIQYCKKRPELASVLLTEIENINVQLCPGRSEYNGPNCSKILKHFVDNPNLNGCGIDLLRLYAKIEAYAVARDLTEEEINGLDQAIKDFFVLIDDKYPDLPGKKTKLHMLKHHVMPFVREHKSWGKFSAQALESSHHVKNVSDTRIQGKTPLAKSKQMDYFMNQQMLINFFTNEDI